MEYRRGKTDHIGGICMSKEIIRNFTGTIIGSYETMPNGDIVIRDFYGKIRGKYDKYCDVTRDFYGKVLARGDQSGMLIRDVDKDR